MAGGYANPAHRGRNLTLKDRVNATPAAPATPHPATGVWLIPDNNRDRPPLRGEVEDWTQDGTDWIATVRITAQPTHSQ